MENRVLPIFLVSVLLLVFCPLLLFSKQSAQQSRPVTQFGPHRQMVNPVPIPPDARPPDRFLQGSTVSGLITALAFSPDGKYLAWSGYDDTIMIWNAATGAEERKLTWARGSSSPMSQIVFSPDGAHLLAITSSKLRIWDLQTDKAEPLNLQGRVSYITYSPDGKIWAAITFDPHEDSIATIQIVNASTEKVLRTISTKWWSITGVTITPDGQLVAAGTVNEDMGDEHDPKGTVQVWDLASGNLLKTSPEFPVVGEISPDGRLMANPASADQSNAPSRTEGIIVTDLSTGKVKWTLPQSDTFRLVFSLDSKELLVTDASDIGFTVWSLTSGASITSAHAKRDPNNPTALNAATFSPDSKRIAAASYPGFSAKTWDVAAGQELQTFAGQLSVQTLVIGPDGKWLVSAAPALTVQDATTGKVITSLSFENAQMIELSPDGRWLAARGTSLAVWDTTNWTRVADLPLPRDSHGYIPTQWIAFGADSTSQSKLGNAESVQFTANGHAHTIWLSPSAIAVSPGGKFLVQLGYPLNNVDVWDTSSGQKIQTFLAHKVGVQYLAFSRDGRSLLTIGQNSLRTYNNVQGINEFGVKVWDVTTWKETTSVSIPQVRPTSALLSPDGHKLAIERSRQLVDLVDADNGSSLGTFATTAPESNPGWSVGKSNVAFSADGTLLYQGAKGGIRVWKIPLP